MMLMPGHTIDIGHLPKRLENAMSKHTPGEWKLASDEGAGFVYSLNARGVNRFWFNVSPGNLDDKSRTPDEECMANARLCAAAPELLRALKRCLPLIEGEVPMEAIAAIAKAEGA
jgi:hypothetical protein